jgi:hypothetical protein
MVEVGDRAVKVIDLSLLVLIQERPDGLDTNELREAVADLNL